MKQCPSCGTRFPQVRMFLADTGDETCQDPWHETEKAARVRPLVGGKRLG